MLAKNLSFDSLPLMVVQLAEKLEKIEGMLATINSQPKEQEDELLNVHQAAALLGLTVPTIYSKVSRHELPVMKGDKKLYFSKADLMSFIKQGRRLTNYEIDRKADNYIKRRA
ncbi:MAG: helix-turn-helix domain-containing protein [Mangrovibacterium sp.]